MSSAKGFTKKATTPEKASKWSKIANAVLGKTGDDSQAIRIANASLKAKPQKSGGKIKPTTKPDKVKKPVKPKKGMAV